MMWRQRLAHEKQPKIADWGLLVNKNMVKVQARVLPPPNIKYDHRSINPREGKWNLRGLRFIRDGNRPLKNWAVVSFDRYCDTDSMQRWITFLVRRLQQLGVKVVNPRPALIPPVDPRIPGSITKQLQLAARAAYSVDQQGPQLICAILPGKCVLDPTQLTTGTRGCTSRSSALHLQSSRVGCTLRLPSTNRSACGHAVHAGRQDQERPRH